MQKWIVYGHKDRLLGFCDKVTPDYIWVYHTLHTRFIECYSHFLNFSENYTPVNIKLMIHYEPIIQNVDEYIIHYDDLDVIYAVISLDTVGDWF